MTDAIAAAARKTVDDFTSDLEVREHIDDLREALGTETDPRACEALRAQLTLAYNRLGYSNEPLVGRPMLDKKFP